jgi:integrase
MGRRGAGEGSYYRLPSGKWRVVVSIGSGADGRRKRIYRTAKTRADAVVILRDLSARAARGVVESSAATVGEALAAWVRDFVTIERSANTAAQYSRVIQSHLAGLSGVRLAKLSPGVIRSALADLSRAGVGPRSVQLAFSVLSACLSNLVRLGAIPENPCRRLEAPKYERKRIEPFTAEEIRSLLDASAGAWSHAAIVLAAACGMRQGEILGLHWEQVDFDGASLSIDRQAVDVGGRVSIDRPKTSNSVRVVALPPVAVEALQSHRAILLRMGRAGSPLVFSSARGVVVRKVYFINRIWAEMLEAAGVRRRGFHHLRHSFATLSLGAGVPVHVVSSILGHSAPSITHDVYSHVLGADLTSATAAIDRIIPGAGAAKKRRKSV